MLSSSAPPSLLGHRPGSAGLQHGAVMSPTGRGYGDQPMLTLQSSLGTCSPSGERLTLTLPSQTFLFQETHHQAAS